MVQPWVTIVPVIERELRSQARQPITYLLRWAGAIAICLAFWMAFEAVNEGPQQFRGMPVTAGSAGQNFQQFGVELFGKLNLSIFIAIWLFTPLAAADSISRERREGTLPLLQLTRLKPWEIVLGKSFVHILRSSTLFLTMVPWLVVPFLFGGIGLQDLQLALMLDLAALFLAQAAGIVASTFSRDWLKAVLAAEILAVGVLLVLMGMYETVLSDAFSAVTLGSWRYTIYYSGSQGFLDTIYRLLDMLTNGSVQYEQNWAFGLPRMGVPQSSWQRAWATLPPAGELIWIKGVLTILAFSITVFFAAIALAASIVRRSWQEKGRSVQIVKLREKYFTPRYGVAMLQRRLSRSLSRNPIGWLHHYSPSARMTKWSWCLVLILVEMVFASNYNDLYQVQVWLGFALVFGILFSSTGSFRQELESGAFELLLVTPISEWQIWMGRLRGIWYQFFPAFAIFGAGFAFLGSASLSYHQINDTNRTLILFGLLLFSAPIVGIYFSLIRWNFLLSWICASLITVATPMFLLAIDSRSTANAILGQILLVWIFGWLALDRLRNRLALTYRSE